MSNEQGLQLQRDSDQMKQLVKPVINEDKRIEALLKDENARKAL